MKLLPFVVPLMSALLLAGCGTETASKTPMVPTVLVRSAVLVDYAATLALTGDIQARNAGDLAFRVGGRVLERYVDVGDRVEAGQKLATIDAAQQRAMQASAAAALAAGEAQLDLNTSAHERQQTLFEQGVATRSAMEQAFEALSMAQGNVDAARAQLRATTESLDQTTLLASGPGVITARYIEAGQVVQAAQPVFAFAADGERDAVFDIYEAALLSVPDTLAIKLRLASGDQGTFEGTVREVAPSVDTQTGTIRVRVAIDAPQADLPLGATIVGSAMIAPQRVVVLPASALTLDRGRPAVWVVDAKTRMLALRTVTIAGFETEQVTLSEGLVGGELVVVRGPRSMRVDQMVEISPESVK